jgi:hypothetical protein
MSSPVPAAYAFKLMLFFIPSTHTKLTILTKILSAHSQSRLGGLPLAILICACILLGWYTIYEGQFKDRYVANSLSNSKLDTSEDGLDESSVFIGSTSPASGPNGYSPNTKNINKTLKFDVGSGDIFDDFDVETVHHIQHQSDADFAHAGIPGNDANWIAGGLSIVANAHVPSRKNTPGPMVSNHTINSRTPTPFAASPHGAHSKILELLEIDSPADDSPLETTQQPHSQIQTHLQAQMPTQAQTHRRNSSATSDLNIFNEEFSDVLVNSEIFTSAQILKCVIQWLPPDRQHRKWKLRYSLLKDGASLGTLLTQCGVTVESDTHMHTYVHSNTGVPSGIYGHTGNSNINRPALHRQAKGLNSYIVIVEDSWGYKFGGYIGHALEHNAVSDCSMLF